MEGLQPHPNLTLGFFSHPFNNKQIIEGEVAAGVPSEKIVLGGFSQGGAVTLHVALRTTTKLAGKSVSAMV